MENLINSIITFDNDEKYIVNTCVWKIEKEDADQCNVSE